MLPNATYLGSARIRFHKSLHLRRRRIDHHRFLLIESGRGEFRFSDTSLSIDGRHLLLLSPGQRETCYSAAVPVSYLYVEFDVDSDTDLIPGPYHECSADSIHWQTLTAMITSVHRERGIGVDLLLVAAVQLAQLNPTGPRSDRSAIDPRIRKAVTYIEQHLDQILRVPDLAAAAGLSLPHFRRLFLKTLKVSPKQYLIRERMHHARNILRTEGLQVGEVADLLHFENAFQFSNQYKKVHGHSPLQDRR